MIHSNSTTRKVVEYIRAHPGTTRPSILTVLPDGTKPHSVSSILVHLAKTGVVENRGRSGRAARWFPIELVVDIKFRNIARELLSELKNIHHSQTGVVENRGRSGRAARWFPIELVVDIKFRNIARELLSELKNIHHSQREDYLAKRLQELFG